MGYVKTFRLLFLTIALLCMPSLYLYSTIQPMVIPFDERLEQYGISEKTTALPVTYRPKILIWAKQYHSIDWTLPDLPGGDGGCDVTWNRNEYSASDAVVFYMKSCSAKDLPNKRLRSTSQAFIWWAHESPWTVLHYYRHDLFQFHNYFNWTMTYRRDADVLASFAPAPVLDYLLYKFGRLKDMRDQNLTRTPPMSEKTFAEQTKLLISNKSKFIAWVASDCDITSGATRRMKLVKEMIENGSLQIDKFGKCAENEIDRNFTVLFQTLSSYKFYLAFENSYHCRDYITEKTFYNSLVSAAVPVIHGTTKEDTLKIMPAGSFIHVEDFKNVTSLASYLKYLNQNDSAYLEYFNWWREPIASLIPRFGFNYGSGKHKNVDLWRKAIQDDMMEIERLGFYELCRKLKKLEHIKTSKVIKNLHELWFDTDSEECLKK